MVSVIKRMRTLRVLLDIRIGRGAAILPPEVKRLHLEFPKGPTPKKAIYFWQNHLPRLKYHNPSIPMTLTRTDDPLGPSVLTVHLDTPTPSPSPSSSSDSAPTDNKIIINMAPAPKDTVSAADADVEPPSIIQKLLDATRARPYQPTEAEKQQIADIEEANRRSEEDRVRMAALTVRWKKEKAMLAQARGEITA